MEAETSSEMAVTVYHSIVSPNTYLHQELCEHFKSQTVKLVTDQIQRNYWVTEYDTKKHTPEEKHKLQYYVCAGIANFIMTVKLFHPLRK
jgi:hypothetical protein